MTAEKKKIRIQYTRSKICTPIKHKLVVKGLGFTRLNQIVEREDTPSIRGMVKAIPHLVRIVVSGPAKTLSIRSSRHPTRAAA